MNNSTNSAFKKGDRVFIVTVSTGGGGGGVDCFHHTDKGFRTTVRAELVTLTSLGKVQGTAKTEKGNYLRQIYRSRKMGDQVVPGTTLVATREEVEAIAAKIGTAESAKRIAAVIAACEQWKIDFAVRGLPLGHKRNASELETARLCKPSLEIVFC